MTINLKNATVTKDGKRWIVSGVVHFVGGRPNNSIAWSRAAKSKGAADHLAAIEDAANVQAATDYAECRARRIDTVRAYCAARAARPSAAQMSFGF